MGRLMRKSLVSLLLLMIMVIGTGALAMSVSGCSKAEPEEKLTPADFTVVCYDDIPKDFLREIEEKKETDFKLTCISDGWLYIARGYGKQNTGGYSIVVKEVSVSDNAVYFDSELIGPKQGEAANKLATYPYVVVKIEDAGRSVVFR